MWLLFTARRGRCVVVDDVGGGDGDDVDNDMWCMIMIYGV